MKVQFIRISTESKLQNHILTAIASLYYIVNIDIILVPNINKYNKIIQILREIKHQNHPKQIITV